MTCGYWPFGQLGYGSSNSYTWQQVPGLGGGFVYTADGSYHTLAVKSDGSVWAWGKNDYGQLGDYSNTDRHSPVQVHGLTGVVQVDGGYGFSLALKSDGTVWAWGRNSMATETATTDRHLQSR
jgi:alpha-tubulin suppressor-like RCC1 family protein